MGRNDHIAYPLISFIFLRGSIIGFITSTISILITIIIIRFPQSPPPPSTDHHVRPWQACTVSVLVPGWVVATPKHVTSFLYGSVHKTGGGGRGGGEREGCQDIIRNTNWVYQGLKRLNQQILQMLNKYYNLYGPWELQGTRLDNLKRRLLFRGPLYSRNHPYVPTFTQPSVCRS